MDVRNCKGCGRLFNVIGKEKLCPACRKALDDKFAQVKEYLENNPNSSVDKVAIENDVSTKQIRQWVREERLIFAEGSVEGIDCEGCGKMIRTGRFCDDCKNNLTKDLMGAIKKPRTIEEPKKRQRDGDKMRFI